MRVSITSLLVQQCHAPGLVTVMKFKTTKINFERLFGLSTKISTHENYPPYGNHNVCVCLSLSLSVREREREAGEGETERGGGREREGESPDYVYVHIHIHVHVCLHVHIHNNFLDCFGSW